MKNKFSQTLKYLLFDALSASTAWTLFFYYRSVTVEDGVFTASETYVKGITIITIFWIALYFILGAYKNIYRKSRLKELGQTLYSSILGVTILFFLILIDDFIVTYRQYYFSYLMLFSYHFGLTAIFRFLLSSITAYKIHKKIIGFNTLIIGSNNKAVKLFQDLKNEFESSGHNIQGFINIEDKKSYLLSEYTNHLGNLKSIQNIIKNYKIEDIIIAIETSEHKKISSILNELESTSMFIKIIPDMYDILSGSVKMNSILGTPLIEIKHELLPQWERLIKIVFDYLFAVIAIILFSPIYILMTIMVKISSPGNIIYKQERIGQFGKKFNIYKFRSMYSNSEKNGPQLSSLKDNRITDWGRFMRKTRLDETPQFFNILKGDMSFVGPRPERDFYAKQIILKAPHYKHLYKVKPGITSWGMVKYGYAENIDQMLERLKYDILYIENMSFMIDVKIMVHTILIILERRGK